jgi:hypothetical protein
LQCGQTCSSLVCCIQAFALLAHTLTDHNDLLMLSPQNTVYRAQSALQALRDGVAFEDTAERLKGVLLHSLAGLHGVAVNMFLDATTIMRGWNQEDAMAVWIVWHGTIAVGFYEELTRRCLLGVDVQSRLVVHDVLEVLGRSIMKTKTPKLKEHFGSRVWMEGGKAVGRKQVGP